MNAFSKLFHVPILTRGRVWAAMAVALVADGIQILLGPLGWVFIDEIIDVVAMIATWWLLGFHPLFLPTFALEFIPAVDMLPTWTGCVALVVAARRKQRPGSPVPAGVSSDSKIIDV